MMSFDSRTKHLKFHYCIKAECILWWPLICTKTRKIQKFPNQSLIVEIYKLSPLYLPLWSNGNREIKTKTEMPFKLTECSWWTSRKWNLRIYTIQLASMLFNLTCLWIQSYNSTDMFWRNLNVFISPRLTNEFVLSINSSETTKFISSSGNLISSSGTILQGEWQKAIQQTTW